MGCKVIADDRFHGKPANTKEANQVIIENVHQQPSGSVQLRLEYAFSVERRCELTRNFLTEKGIRCEFRKSAKTLCAYGGKEPLLTLGTFSGNVIAFDRTHTIYVRDDGHVCRRWSAKKHANTTYEASKHIESTFLISDYCEC